MFLNLRYSNPKLMHVGHQYVASNFDLSNLKGLIAVDAYHITPDKGLGIFTFDNQANLQKYIPVLKEFSKIMKIDFLAKQISRLE